MNIITIPKKLAFKDDLVVLPRKEYEKLIDFKPRTVREVSMTKQQRLTLARARKNLAQGKTMTIYELRRKLGIKDR